MKPEKDFTKDIADIRQMMERSSKFLLLSGWAGIMAGIYALGGSLLAYSWFGSLAGETLAQDEFERIVLLAAGVLLLAVGTTIYFASAKARKKGEPLWSPTASRVLLAMSVPLAAGGLLIFILLSKGILAFALPLTLVFYGLALYNASKYTYAELGSLGIIQIILGLASAMFGYQLLLWAIGFGVMHIGYGVFMHYKYER